MKSGKWKKLVDFIKGNSIGLTTQWIVLISSLLLAINAGLGVVLTLQSKAAIRTQINERMLDVSNSAAALLDGDIVKHLTAQDAGTPEYQEVARILSCFHNNIELKHIYGVQIVSEKEFAFAIDPNVDDPGEFGEPIAYSEALYYASKGHPGVDQAPMEDRRGRFYSAYSPVFDSSHKVVGIVGVDFDAQWYEDQIRRAALSVVVISILSLVAGGFIVLFITNRMRKRFNGLHHELNILADNVETLTNEISSRPGYKAAQQKSEMAAPVHEPVEEEKKKKKSKKAPDSIESLSDRMRSMQAELRRYISFAHELAYTDVSTGVGNKTAYLERVHALERQIAQGNADFSIAVFDVNGLKTVNDNYGHEYGDMIIADAALVMMRVCKRNRVFRIGGDEFIALLEGFSAWETETLFSTMDKVLESFNANEKTYEMTLSFSKGASTFRPGEDKNFKSVFKRADEAMYLNKTQYYLQFGDRRRRENELSDTNAPAT